MSATLIVLLRSVNNVHAEPSIILASRVLSACSNPSPPPTPPLPAQEIIPEYEDAQLVDISDPFPAQDARPSTPVGLLIPIDGLSAPIAVSSPFALRSSTPTPRRADDSANISQPDLITFDSSTPDARHNHPPEETTPRRATESGTEQLIPASVDDLLSLSPHPTIPSPGNHRGEQLVSPQPLPDKDATVTPDEEMEVVASLGVEVNPAAPSPPIIDVAPPEDEQSVVQSDQEMPAQDTQTTPLRRSSRPRKSRSSLPQTIVNTTAQPTPPKEEIEEIAVAQQQSEPQDNSQRKRKLKTASGTEDLGEGCSNDVPVTPRRLTQVSRVQRELGSLSPLSAAVLAQLLPKPGVDSISRTSTPQPQPSEDDHAPARGALSAPAPATPPYQTTSFVFPKVGPSDVPAGAPRPKSPLRPFSPSKFAEGSRTPARRVPIAQAIADGTYSAQKLPAAFGAVRPPTQPGSPVFKKLALDDPARSPAKRVPMSEAVPIPPPSPGKSLDKGKGKALRPQSPVRASSVPPRERSASAEPQPVLARRDRGGSAEPAARPPARRLLFQRPASSDGVPTSSLKSRTVLPFPLTQQQRSHPAIPEAEEPGASANRPAAPGTSSGAIGAQSVASPAKPGSSLRQPSAGAGSKIPRIGAKPYARPRAADAAPTKLPTPAKPRIVTKAKV